MHVLIFHDAVATAEDKRVLEMVQEVAVEFKGRLVFIEVSADEYQIHQYFYMKSTDLPQVVDEMVPSCSRD